MKKQPDTFGCALRDFLVDHLPRVRGMSPHTVLSYRDTFKLLVRFLCSQGHGYVDVSTVGLEHIGPAKVAAFLHHLETDRRNTAATRNVRLAAIHSFFRYVGSQHPAQLEQCQRVLSIPFKRAKSRLVEYLEYDEIQAVLAAVDRTTLHGRRDYALLVAMFNTGSRVQEILDLRPCDLQLTRPFHARLVGKGRKERLCPLLPQTGQVLRTFLSEGNVNPDSHEPLFRNRQGKPLTRFGVRYILAKYCHRAAGVEPTVAAKRLHPHSMRHSTAVHMLQAGVDLTTIAHWLGHSSPNTTNRYTAVDLTMKREAIAKAKPVGRRATASSWRRNASILQWLESL